MKVSRSVSGAALAGCALIALAGCTAMPSQEAPAAMSPCEAPSGPGSVVVGSGLRGDPAAPEPASGYRLGKTLVQSDTYMVVTANPLASRAGCDILKAGGSAMDAAVAVQAVLGLVEPQSSGIGGGAFLLHYNAATDAVTAYDGRETAPAAATANYLRWQSDTDRRMPQPDIRASGRSVGTPGVLRMLETAHHDHGRLAWQTLFTSAITLAREGFPIGGRMADALATNAGKLARDADAAALYLNADGSPRTWGSTFRNLAYAHTLESVAQEGVDVFYTGSIASDIVAKVTNPAAGGYATPVTPGHMTQADLADYREKRRHPVCTTYRAYWVCGMPPPSSGGITVASALGILENFPLAGFRPEVTGPNAGTPPAMAVHLISEAERLAYADRDKYIADTDFVPLPGGSWETMLDKTYLAARARRIDPHRSMGTAMPGELGDIPQGIDATQENGTTHVSIVDRHGNALAMTSSVEGSMGSYRATRGFVLNNQLTDFSADPTDAAGRDIANRVEPGKRPRSSMAPTLVFHRAADGSRGEFLMATGSPGGSAIIQYVVKTLVAVLDWGLDAQQASAMVAFGAANHPRTSVGGEHPDVDTTDDGQADALVRGLREKGHIVTLAAQSSGIATIIRTREGGVPVLSGGADPRREGVVLGDTRQQD